MDSERKKAGKKKEFPVKQHERSPHKNSLMTGGLFSGDPYAPFVIVKAAKVDPSWESSCTTTTNGQQVKAQMYATKHGGQNAASFRAWLDLVVMPSHPSLWGFANDGEPPPDFMCPAPWDKQMLMLLDGDFSHIGPDNLDCMAWKGINTKPPPPWPGADPGRRDLAKTSCFGKNVPHPTV